MTRLGDVAAIARGARGSVAGGDQLDVAARRRLVAEFFKLIDKPAGDVAVRHAASDGTTKGGPNGASPDRAAPGVAPHLSPRERQTLDLLLRGDGEKQIAAKLKLSQHTVHIYVKALHKRFGVSSRAELLARFIPLPPAARRHADSSHLA